MKIGKVWLIGAGPGDVELLTVKAQKLLSQADVVVYDSLVGMAVLALIPENAKRIFVGKRAGCHSVDQKRINQILLEEALQGLRVVRLKGGDPFVFGRGGEELELLLQHHIPYEIVPGVTSAVSVPAYAGIPVTHREFTSSLHIITGHNKEGSDRKIDYKALVRLSGTYIFLMGVHALKEICDGFLAADMNKNTPAAVIENGTLSNQKTVIGTIDTIYEKAMNANIKTPAVIVVGEVCKLAQHFSWKEALPLHDTRVIVTRPREMSRELTEKLRCLGAEVWDFPTIRINPLKNQNLLQNALLQIQGYDWIIFTSPMGVRVFFDVMRKEKIDIRALALCKIAVIGYGTLKELEKYHVFADVMPSIYDGEHLGLDLLSKCKDGDRILIPRAKNGNQELVAILRRKKVHIDDIPTYETVFCDDSFLSGEICKKADYVIFTSASTVRGFAACTELYDTTNICAICIGKQTQKMADALGIETYVAKEATVDSIIEKLVSVKSGKKEF